MIRRIALALASLTTGLLLCGALAAHLGLRAQDWPRLIHGFSWPWASAVVLLSFFLWQSAAQKWALWSRALHGEGGKEPSQGFFLRHSAWQNWFGLFLPPSLAIIAGRSWAARHLPSGGWRSGAGGAFYDQIMEFALLAGLIPASVLRLYGHVNETVWLLTAAAGMAAAGAVILACRSRLPHGINALLFPLLGWSALRVTATILSYVAGVKALGLGLDPSYVAAAAPVVALLVLIPLTPGNLGLAEWGWTGVLAYAGASAVEVGLFAIGFRIMMIAAQSALLLTNETLWFLKRTGKA